MSGRAYTLHYFSLQFLLVACSTYGILSSQGAFMLPILQLPFCNKHTITFRDMNIDESIHARPYIACTLFRAIFRSQHFRVMCVTTFNPTTSNKTHTCSIGPTSISCHSLPLIWSSRSIPAVSQGSCCPG